MTANLLLVGEPGEGDHFWIFRSVPEKNLFLERHRPKLYSF
jgi:hypothetical protein